MQIIYTKLPQTKRKKCIFRMVSCTAVYLVSVGALSSMAGLGWTLFGAWGAGTVLLLALCFLPEQAKIQSIVRLSLFLLLDAAVWILWESARDGVCLFLNRLFAASELQQAYLYEKLPVHAPQAEQAGCLQTAAILLGSLLAQLLTLPSRFSRTFVLAALCGVMAYLGVLPERGWLIALAGCLLLTLLPQDGGLRPWRLLPIAAAFVLLAAGCLLLPETENAQLSAWEERARDSLAVQTAAYGEVSAQQDVPAEQTPQSEPPTFRQEPMQSTLDGDREPLSHPIRAALVIFLLLLILFVPSIYLDRLKKKRERNRTGLSDADARVCICASFRYVLRWLRLAGMESKNIPFAGYSEKIGTILGPEIAAQYLQVLPLWQEASYSTHEMTEQQCAQMRTFLKTVPPLVWKNLSKMQQLWVTYWLAL